ILRETDGLRLIEAHRSQGTPLGGLSLPALATRAAAAGAEHATVVINTFLDAEREAALTPVLARVKSGTGVVIDILDAEKLLSRVRPHQDISARYFPDESDAQEAAADQNIPKALVRVAYVVAPKTPPSPTGHGRNKMRLAWTAGAVLLFIWLPLKLNPF